jgi:glutamate 5-kinase
MTGKQKKKKRKKVMNELNRIPIINENDAHTIYIVYEFRVKFIVIP